MVGADYAVSSDDDDTSSTRSALQYSEEAQPEEKPSSVSKTAGPVKVTRFGPGDSGAGGQNVSPQAGRPRRRGGSPDGGGQQQGRLMRNRSMVDVRSQLLHRTLVEELNKRMFFNTVGAVENIGFRRIPGYGGGGGGGGASSSSATRTSSRGGGGEQRGRRSVRENKHQFFMV